MRLETHVQRDLVARAAWRQFKLAYSRRAVLVGLVLLIGPVVFWAVTGNRSVLLWTALPIVLAGNTYRVIRKPFTQTLALGTPVEATWSGHSVAISWPTRAAAFDYANLSVTARDDSLVQVQVRPPGGVPKVWLQLPSAVVPADLEARLEAARSAPAPYRAPAAQHTAQVGDDFGTGVIPAMLSTRPWPIRVLLIVFEALMIVLIYWSGGPYFAGLMVAFLGLLGFSWYRLGRDARRRFPVGSVLGASMDAGGMELVLPSGWYRFGLADVRRFDPIGPRYVSVIRRDPTRVDLFPRELFPDPFIDEVRRRIGHAPMPARLRLRDVIRTEQGSAPSV